MTQDELAWKIGVSVKTIGRWEKGINTPSLEDTNKLADALRVSVSNLFNSDAGDNIIVAEEIHNIYHRSDLHPMKKMVLQYMDDMNEDQMHKILQYIMDQKHLADLRRKAG